MLHCVIQLRVRPLVRKFIAVCRFKRIYPHVVRRAYDLQWLQVSAWSLLPVCSLLVVSDTIGFGESAQRAAAIGDRQSTDDEARVKRTNVVECTVCASAAQNTRVITC